MGHMECISRRFTIIFFLLFNRFDGVNFLQNRELFCHALLLFDEEEKKVFYCSQMPKWKYSIGISCKKIIINDKPLIRYFRHCLDVY